jgi:hypothetical protein
LDLGPRTHNAAPKARSIPPDLEAACLKALSHNPVDRYASVQSLRSDIAAFLEGRTLAAARYTFAQLARLWIKRNKVFAATAGAAAALLAMASSFYVVNVTQAKREAETQAARADQNAERERTEAKRARTAEMEASRQADIAIAQKVATERVAELARKETLRTHHHAREAICNAIMSGPAVAELTAADTVLEKSMGIRKHDDGNYSIQHHAGHPCIGLSRNSAADHRYLYVDVLDGLINEEEGAILRIEFHDDATGIFSVEYGSGDKTASMGGKYKGTEAVRMMGTNAWKTCTLILPDARFENQQNAGSDFRLFAPQDLFVRRIQLFKGGPQITRMREALQALNADAETAQGHAASARYESWVRNLNFELGSLIGWEDVSQNGTARVAIDKLPGNGPGLSSVDTEGDFGLILSSQNPTDYGAVSSPVFIPTCDEITFDCCTENPARVHIEIQVLDAHGDSVQRYPIVNAGEAFSTGFKMTTHRVDVSGCRRTQKPIRLVFRQNTLQAGFGWATLIDNVRVNSSPGPASPAGPK